jgi:hypothetical protein
MKRLSYLLIIGCIMLSLSVAGCGIEKARSSQAAIEKARTISSAQGRIDYLESQTKAFYNAKDFKGTIDIALFTLRYLDNHSQVSADLLTKSRNVLKAQTRLQANDAMRVLE